jgi:hypothetical protein
MTPACRRLVGVLALSTALLAVEGSAAASPAPSRAPTGALWGDQLGGQPLSACAPSNDGAEVTTLVFIPHPFPIGVLVGWICDGATGAWQRR